MLHDLQQPWYEFLLSCLGVFLGVIVLVFILVFGAMGIMMSLQNHFGRDKPQAKDRHA